MTRARAFSLIEVVVAIGVLAIAGLGLLAALTRGITSQNYSSHQTAAILIGESALQEAVLGGPPRWGMTDINVPDVVLATVGQNSSPTEFRYAVEYHHAAREETTHSMGILYEVRVRVWWHENGDGPERGARDISLTKMVYIES